MNGIFEGIAELMQLGEPIDEVGVVAMVLRTVVVYGSALLLVRLASRRLLAKASAFDVIVAIMLGSILSRAINSSAPLLPTLAAGAVLLVMQWLLAFIAVHTQWMGPVVKGEPLLLILDGHVQHVNLRRAGLTGEDLTEIHRRQVNDDDPSKVRRAYLERNGKVSVVPFLPEERRPATHGERD